MTITAPRAPGLFGDIVSINDLDDFIDEYESFPEPTDGEIELYMHIQNVRAELVRNSGDEEFFTAIADHHFKDYAEDLAHDIGAINRDMSWPLTHIDWSAAADELKQDYAAIDIAGTTYWYR